MLKIKNEIKINILYLYRAYSNFRVPEKLKTDKDFLIGVIARNENIQNHLIANSQFSNTNSTKPVKVIRSNISFIFLKFKN